MMKVRPHPVALSMSLATISGRSNSPRLHGSHKHAGLGTSENVSRIEASAACPIQALTSHGLRTIAGLQVAYLNVADKSIADQLIEEINAADGDLDLLITSEWPANVTELATKPSGLIFCLPLSACMQMST